MCFRLAEMAIYQREYSLKGVFLILMRVLVTGSSGLIGSALCEKLRDTGHVPVRLIRHGTTDSEAISREATDISWDPATGIIDADALEGCDAVVHLAGAGIGDKRWHEARKQEITNSRIGSTHFLATALAKLADPPKVFLSGSAIGIYGETGDNIVTEEIVTEEDVPLAEGFLANLCQQWEAATAPAAEAGIRTVLLRTGIVVDSKAPFLKRQLPLFKLGLGGRLGSKSRWISWISLEDEVAAILWLLEHTDISGPVNLTAPNPVTNGEFTKTLGKVLRRPTLLPIPKLLPSLLLGRELINALTESTRAIPKALTDHGYPFIHPHIEPALRAATQKFPPDHKTSQPSSG